MRYFNITVSFDGKHAEASFRSKVFPSRTEIVEIFRVGSSKIVIINIFEFKNEEDFNSFKR